MFRKSLLAAMIGAISLAHAADWNAEILATARQQAEAEINQYLRDGSGPIARFANADIRTWREHAQYGKGKKGEPRNFAHLQNGGELLAKIAASAPYDEKIRFLALLQAKLKPISFCGQAIRTFNHASTLASRLCPR